VVRMEWTVLFFRFVCLFSHGQQTKMENELRAFLDPLHALKAAVFEELLREPLFGHRAADLDCSNLNDERHLLMKQLRRATGIGMNLYSLLLLSRKEFSFVFVVFIPDFL
jgi:hypothetical protein